MAEKLNTEGIIRRVFRKNGDNDYLTDKDVLICDYCGSEKPGEEELENCPCGRGEFWIDK